MNPDPLNEEKIDALRKSQARTETYMIGVAVVVGLAFVLYLLQAFAATQAAFNNLTNQINQQNTAIQVLITKVDALSK